MLSFRAYYSQREGQRALTEHERKTIPSKASPGPEMNGDVSRPRYRSRNLVPDSEAPVGQGLQPVANLVANLPRKLVAALEEMNA